MYKNLLLVLQASYKRVFNEFILKISILVLLNNFLLCRGIVGYTADSIL